jgi:hypothetical protein
MTTGTAGTTARQYHQQMLHYLRKGLDEVSGTSITVGTLPSGAVIVAPISGIQIRVVFSGTNPVADIGITGTLEKYASDLDLDAAVAFLPLDVTTAIQVVDADTPIICTLDLSTPVGADGSAECLIFYCPDNDG